MGDFVQWTSQGVDRFKVPYKVVGIDGDFAFVAESKAGIPMSELAVVDPPQESTKAMSLEERHSHRSTHSTPHLKKPHQCRVQQKRKRSWMKGQWFFSVQRT